MAKSKRNKPKQEENPDTIQEDLNIEEIEEEVIEEVIEPEMVEAEKAEPSKSIDLQQFCDSLGNSGVDKFAYVRIEAYIKQGNMPAGPHTREKWEEYYMELKKL